MFTEVVNLSTNEVWLYNLPPKEAVRNAFFQSRGRMQSNEYPPIEQCPFVQIGSSGKTVIAGDFIALLPKNKIFDERGIVNDTRHLIGNCRKTRMDTGDAIRFIVALY